MKRFTVHKLDNLTTCFVIFDEKDKEIVEKLPFSDGKNEYGVKINAEKRAEIWEKQYNNQ